MRRLLLAVVLAPTAAVAFPFAPLAPADEVKSIVAEMELPGMLTPEAATPLARVRYPAAALKDYAEDVPVGEIRKKENIQKYSMRLVVLDAFEGLRGGWANDGRQLRPALPAEITHLTKADVRREQGALAEMVPRLDLHYARLEAYEPSRNREPKRWRAHLDYALAELAWRLAITAEYNELLGRVRTENLPPLDPARDAGYRLKATDAPAAKRAKDHLKDARERFAAVVRDHPNTPWAVAASRALRQPPGLAWEPAPRR